MKLLKGLAALFVTMCILISCNTSQRLKVAEHDAHTNLRHPFKKENSDTTKILTNLPQTVTIVKKDKEEPQQKFFFSFDSIQNTQLDEIVVTASTKSVAERNGQLNLDFVVTIPGSMMKQDWKMVIKPVLDNRGDYIQLDSMVIYGWQNKSFQRRKDRQLQRAVENRRKLASRRRNTGYRFEWLEKKIGYQPDSVLIQDTIMPWMTQTDEGIKLDTVITDGKDYSYYYSQKMSSENLASTVKVFMNSYIKNCDDVSYPLTASDTIRFYIASFLQFLDNTPRYVRKIISRRVTDRMSANIQFNVGQYALVDTLGENETEFEKVAQRLQEIAKGNEFIIDSVTVTAYASPEGTEAANLNLARNRSNALKQYLVDNDVHNILPEEENIKVGSKAEDWERLAQMVYKAPEIVNAEQILQIIKDEPDMDRREQKIRTAYPQDYAYMIENMYPKLRAVDFVFHLARRNMVEDVMYTDEIDTQYAEAINLMKERKYKEAMPKLLEYRDWNTAICYMSMGYNNTALQIINEMEVTSDTEYLKSILYARENNIEKAIECYLTSCRMDESKAMRGEMDPELAELIKAYGLNKEFEYEY